MDYKVEYFNDAAKSIPWEWATLNNGIALFCALYLIKMLFTWKKTMSLARSVMFTDAALIIGATYAALGFCVWKLS